ncbi:(5-formylfuran-3-yl)methyl phosphate synthase, partial [Escherichia coli]|nr:(5-formylfuran-3-yl)methyl phosphate synthase [Escherichia coli]
MTKMLAIVRSPEEADIVLLCGADIIDVPASDLQALQTYAKAARGKAVLSATLPEAARASHAGELAGAG